MATTQRAEGEQLLQEIGKHVYLVVLNISWPKLSYQIADAIVEVVGAGERGENVQVAEQFRNKPQWSLMPTEWHRKFSKIEHQARTALSRASLAFATKGMAILPMTRADDVFMQLRELRASLQQHRDTFVAEYNDILANLRNELGEELYDKAARKLPDGVQISNKFDMRWAIFPMGGGTSLSVTAEAVRQVQEVLSASRTADGVVDPEALDLAQGTLATLTHELANPVNRIGDESAMSLIREAHEQMAQIAQQVVEDIAREPRAELARAIDHLLESLQTGRTIKNGTIGAIERAFELVKGFQFLADDELLNRIREGEAALRHVTVRQLNGNREIGARLAGTLSRVREQAADAEAATKAVRQFRGIRIRPRPSPEPVGVS